VIKIEQHPSPIKGKILDRFDIDMAGCIECALCVEACPFRAITMAPDFEMASTYDRTVDLVYDMYELRIPGTPEIDAGMEHIQGVKRGLKGQGAPAAAAPARAAAAPAAARPTPAAAAAPAAPAPAASAAAPAAAAPAAPVADAPKDYDPLTISDDDLKKLPASERALVYRARLKASGWQAPAAKA
jgi:ferredoxin